MNEFPFDLLRINQLPRIFCCISFCSMHMVIIHLLPLAIQIALGLSKEHLLCFSFFFSNKVKKHEQIASNHLPRDILQQECSSGSLELVLRWNVIENTPCVLYNVTLHANKMKKKLFCFTMNQSNCVIVNVLFYLVWLWKKPLSMINMNYMLNKLYYTLCTGFIYTTCIKRIKIRYRNCHYVHYR